MTMRRMLRVGVVTAGVGAGLGVLGAIFVVIGLEQADQLAGVLGLFIGLTGLGVSVYGLRHPAGHAQHGAASTSGTATGTDTAPSLLGPAARQGARPGPPAGSSGTTGPTEPRRPAEPGESAPSGPGGSTKPAGPGEPGGSAEPAPSGPGRPGGSTNPAGPSGPTEPAGPAEAARPSVPRSEVVRRYGGDHVEFHDATFHGPVTGKNVGRQENGPGDDDPT